MKKNIFISYRHQDVDFARSLSYALKYRGYKEVFLDYKDITDGNYKQVIYNALENSRILILILGDETFKKCCNPDDMLRQELETAINIGITIIPVICNNNFTHYPEDMPSHIRQHLVHIQISEIHRGTLFESSVNTFIKDRIRPNMKINWSELFNRYLQKHPNIKYPIISLSTILLISIIIICIKTSINWHNYSGQYNIPIEMQYIHGGTFTMGIRSEDAYGALTNASPTHPVHVDDYIIGKYEVTQEQWEMVMGDNPSSQKGAKLPVHDITWDDCQLFITKLNIMTGLTFRMPTEAEWEYAALGGKTGKEVTNFSGDKDINNVAWYMANSGGQCHEVGSLSANGYGLYDMSGNIEEWCKDFYDQYISDSLNVHYNPTKRLWAECKVHRGGSYGSDSQQCNIKNRNMHKHQFKSPRLGLRLALDIPISLEQLYLQPYKDYHISVKPLETYNYICMINDEERMADIFQNELLIKESSNTRNCAYVTKDEVMLWFSEINHLYGLGFTLPTVDDLIGLSAEIDQQLYAKGIWCYNPETDGIVIYKSNKITLPDNTSRAVILVRSEELIRN